MYPGRVNEKWKIQSSTNGAEEATWFWGASEIEGTGSAPEATAIELAPPGGAISPLMFDTHTHGCLGRGVVADTDQMATLVDSVVAMGVGRVQLSTVSLPLDALHAILDTARQVGQTRSELVGIHLEGPFLSAEKKGAHSVEFLRHGSMEAVRTLVGDYLDVVSSITVDPLSVDEGVIAWLVDSGVTVAIGHTPATYQQATHAFDEGASVLTHAFNAMPPISSREPGPVLAALDSGAAIEIIADGHHVHPATIAMLFEIAPDQMVLVTDSMPAAGLGDGHYDLEGFEVSVDEGVARTRSGAIAGSTVTLAQSVANVVSWGVDSTTALAAAVTNPLVAYGQTVPRIEAGHPADFAVWSPSWELTHVVRGGVAVTPQPR